MNPYKDAEESSFTASLHLCYEDIASKLLKDHYFLTALELHTELVESGKELPQLREFFSNPGNFEQHVSRASDFISMHRTPSLATLDSLDTARYSEDGGGDRGGSGGDVAVLEFELRKARETINALRANLTQFADGDSALDKKSAHNNQRSLKPHEKRALNFLINEYLLLQDYKLTSITFSDENPDQEFEDWDDVGLNMPRPDGLVSLFWGGTSQIVVPKVDASTETNTKCMHNVQCQTECDEENVCVSCQTSIDNDADWNHELLIQAEEIELLKQKILALETEKLNFQKLYDAAIVSLNSLTSPASEKQGLVLQMPEDKLPSGLAEQQQDVKPITYMASENHYGSGNSTNSATPDQFEIVYNEKNNILNKKEDSTSSYEPAVFVESSVRGSPMRPGSVTTLESLSINDEWTRVYDAAAESREMWINSSVPHTLKESLLNWCREAPEEPLANDLLAELVESDKPITLSGLLPLVADTLPRMLPHTLVGRRGEAVALLAAAALLSPGARRSRLLHALLTLYKKPEPRDALQVCQAACLVVKWGGSGEVLSSVAELLTSKTMERRLLASQVCLAIAPYVPLELCSSLLFSLILLMCDSGERDIRSIGLKAACLVCPVAEHKYAQLENILFNFLKDPADKNVQDTVNMFTPIMARSALILRKFSTDLHKRVLNNFSGASGDGEWKNVLLHLDMMRVLVLAQLVYVANVPPVRESDCGEASVLHEVPLSEKANPDLLSLISEEMDVKALIVGLNSLLKRNPDLRWAELDWFIDSLKQILDIVTKNKMLNNHAVYESLITLFYTYIENFGIGFTTKIIRPIFSEMVLELEERLQKLEAVSVDKFVVVGIYVATVLVAGGESERCGEFLQKWVVYCSISGLPVNIFSVPLKWLAKHNPRVLSDYYKHLKDFSASSSDSSSVSAIRTYIANLTTELLNMSSVSDDCLEEHVLPLVLALLEDEDVGVREASIMAWGGAWHECSVRSEAGPGAERWLRCAERCSRGAESLLRRALSAREAARTAHALALLMLPSDQRGQADTAVSLLCTLCARAPLSGEVVAALSAGLQLAAHHRPAHAALMPAIRRLEEAVQTPTLSQYKPTVDALLQLVGTGASGGGGTTRESPRDAHEVGRRVSQMFHAKTNMNLHNIFKKKT